MNWIEKYKPTKLNFTNQKVNAQILENILKLDKIPNLLFFGSPGTSKTSMAINFSQDYFYLVLNASDEKGINIVRDKIKSFCTQKSKKQKIIILDEIDAFTNDAQYVLCNIMDIYHNVVFILVCNYINKLIIPLISRTCYLNFGTTNDKTAFEIIKNILQKEKLKEIYDYKKDYKYFNGDLRHFINHVQILYTCNSCIVKKKSFNFSYLLKEKNTKKLVVDLLTQYDLTNFHFDLLDYILEIKINEKKKYNCIIHISNYDTNIKNKGSDYIELFLLMMNIKNDLL